jgi:glucokinase
MATVGIDIGGSRVRAVLVQRGEILAADGGSTPAAGEDLVEAAAAAVRAIGGAHPEAVGLGVAGLIRWPEGSLAWGPHVAGTDVALRAELEEMLGIPVVVDNDANVAAYGELRIGAAQGYRNVIVVTLGTGIGGAIVIDGEVHRGESFAGEWGHMRWEAGGVLCDCGKRGCWETVASGPALVRLAREAIGRNPESSFAKRIGDSPTGEAITGAADSGDEVARGLVAQVGIQFGLGLCSLIAIFDPEAVIVGGGLGSVGESIIGPARRTAADALHGAAYRLLPPILVAGLGSRAGAVGAAMLAQAVLDREVILEP